MAWLRSQCFERQAEQATFTDYLAEVDHAGGRIERLEKAIDEAIATAPVGMRALVAGLQALRGVAKVTAVTVAAEIGRASRSQRPRQLMGYAGIVPREASSGERTHR
jgi:transposase